MKETSLFISGKTDQNYDSPMDLLDGFTKGIKRMRLDISPEIPLQLQLGTDRNCGMACSVSSASVVDLEHGVSEVDPGKQLQYGDSLILGVSAAQSEHGYGIDLTMSVSDSAGSESQLSVSGSDMAMPVPMNVELDLSLKMPVVSDPESALTSVHLSDYRTERSGESSQPNSRGLVADWTSTSMGLGSRVKRDMNMQLQLGMPMSSLDFSNDCIPMIDEGSTSNGKLILPLLSQQHLIGSVPQQIFKSDMFSTPMRNPDTDVSMNLISPNSATSSGTCCSQSLDRPPKMCQMLSCGKRARGASGLCISHGGGRRCQKQGCNKGAEGSTIFCKAHGGGRRCQSLGCTKSAEGKTDFCIAHGGGHRCGFEGCAKAARGSTGFCIRHGGGKRCQREGCTKSAEGHSGLCILHGGGRRCQYPNCGKGAQGSTMFCKAHGGGKRCVVDGCAKGAEGSTALCKAHGGGKRCMFEGGGLCPKSVHGGTLFCVAHGGGKRCTVGGCTKSARGKTDCCVKHGGGKRCKAENCDKSAQGSTDFCKSHGGGRRCAWGQDSSIHSGQIFEWMGFMGPCDRYAKGKLGLCAIHSALVEDQRVHGSVTFGGTSPAATDAASCYAEITCWPHKEVSSLYKVNVDNQSGGDWKENDLVNVGESEGSESPSEIHSSSGGEKEEMQEDTCHHPKLTLFPSILGETRQTLTSNNTSVMNYSNENKVTATGSSFTNSTVKAKADPIPKPFVYSSRIFGASLVQRQTSVGKLKLGQKSLDDDGIFNMSSLDLPDERVHGGNIMALLSGDSSD